MRISRASRSLAVALVLSLGLGTVLAPRRALAMDRDVRSVIVAGEYGMAAGTVLGLASLPFSQDARTIFIGTSVGLYLGIAVGLYYVLNRDNPDNPLRPQGNWPEEAKRDLSRLAAARTLAPWEPDPARAALQVRLTVLSF